jgi:NhaA family Na+:H+ antiporter
MTPARALPAAVRRFIATEASSGIVLVAAAAVALLWANSPWQDTYERLWHNRVVVQLGGVSLEEDLRHVVNDGLMALFFFVVALEIKREFLRGELADLRVAALPVCAALGGMVVPAALYALVSIGSDAGRGWGIPMATDIAFALGVLALVSSRLPAALKVLLLTLAIVDDIGAIVVIALFYAESFDAAALLIALSPSRPSPFCIASVSTGRRRTLVWPSRPGTPPTNRASTPRSPVSWWACSRRQWPWPRPRRCVGGRSTSPTSRARTRCGR